MTLNLSTEEGQELFRELAEKADVLIHNFRVGTMESWRLGYETLSDRNPGLVYYAISGYGEWGPTVTGRPTTSSSRRRVG